MNACSANKAKSIFQAKREAAEQQRLIRLAYKNQALLGEFILLVDLIFTTRLAKVHLDPPVQDYLATGSLGKPVPVHAYWLPNGSNW